MKHTHFAAALMVSLASGSFANPSTHPARSAPKDRVEQLIEQLGAEEFKTRAAAAGELRKMGRRVLPALKGRRHADPEVESWCAALAEQIDPTPRPDIAQLIAGRLTNRTTFRRADGRLLRIEVEPAIQQARAAEERLLRLQNLRLQRLVEVEVELENLRKQMQQPVRLRLIDPPVVQPPVRRDEARDEAVER